MFVYSSFSQVKVGDNIDAINANSILELESSSKVLVVTRITNSQMNAITPINGAIAFNTDEECLFQYRQNSWHSLCVDLIGGQTVTTISDNADGTFSYINEEGDTVVLEKATITNNNDGTYSFSNGGSTTITVDTNASTNPYDSTTSGINAVTVQEAIDFLVTNSDANATAIIDNTADILDNADAISDNATAITTLGTSKEDTANKSTDGTLADNSDTDFPTEQAVKTYVDSQVGALSQDDDITEATLNATSLLTISEGDTDVTVSLADLEESADITANTNAITANASDISDNANDIATNATAIADETTRATTVENANATAITTNASDISDNETAITANTSAITFLGATKENTANKSTDGTLADNSDTDFPTEQAVKTYVDAQVGSVSQDDDITEAILNASSLLTISEGDTDVTVSLADLEESTDITANTNAITANASDISDNTSDIATNATAIADETTRATTAENANATAITSLGISKEDTANKSTDGTLADNSDTDFPTEQAVKTYVDAQVGSVSQDDDITEATLNTSSLLTISEGDTDVTVSLDDLEESADITANATAIADETTRATTAENANATAITTNASGISDNETAITANSTAIATKENTANKSTDGTLADNSDTDFPTEQAVKTYVDAQVGSVSQDDDITEAILNASSLLTISEGDTDVTVSLADLEESADITANTNAITANASDISDNASDITTNTTAIADETTRATTAENANATAITTNTSDISDNANDIATNATAIADETTRATTAENANATAITSLGATKENTANKSTDGTLADNSDTDFPTEQAVKTYVDAQVGSVSQDDDITEAILNASSLLTISEGDTDVTVSLADLEESADITANTNAITANASDISDNTSDIATNTTAIADETTRATTAENANSTAITSLGTSKEDTANKSTDGTLADNSDTDFPTEQAVKTYVDAQVGSVSQDDDITEAILNASSLLTISEGDTDVTVSLADLEESADITANTNAITANTSDISGNATAIANETTRATTAENANANAVTANTSDISDNETAITANSTAIATKEDTANKSTDGTLADNSDTDFPTEQAVKTYVDAQVGSVSQDDDITEAILNASSLLTISEGDTDVTVSLADL
jgi:hypothetical protein